MLVYWQVFVWINVMIPKYFMLRFCLTGVLVCCRCFDTVGRQEEHPVCKKLSEKVLSGVTSKWFAYGPAYATANQLISCIINIQIGVIFMVPAYPRCPSDMVQIQHGSDFCFCLLWPADWYQVHQLKWMWKQRICLTCPASPASSPCFGCQWLADSVVTSAPRRQISA